MQYLKELEEWDLDQVCRNEPQTSPHIWFQENQYLCHGWGSGHGGHREAAIEALGLKNMPAKLETAPVFAHPGKYRAQLSACHLRVNGQVDESWTMGLFQNGVS